MEMYLAQGHKAGKCWSWDSNINLNKSDSKVLYSVEKRRSHVLKTSFFTLHHITEETTELSSSPTGPPWPSLSPPMVGRTAYLTI